MAGQDDKLTQLVTEFEKLSAPIKVEESVRESDSEGSGIDLEGDSHTLRSGKTYPPVTTSLSLAVTGVSGDNHSTIPVHSPMPSPAGSTSNSRPSTPPPQSNMAQQTIKVLPTECSITEFAGTDSNYSARDFISRCEDVMRNSGITDPGDKISFVRSRLRPASEPHNLMQSSAFTDPTEKHEYNVFRTNFLETFGDYAKKSLVKSVSAVCERVAKEVCAKDELNAQIIAGRSVRDVISMLEDDGYFTADSMSKSNVRSFIEFFIYMLVLQDKKRRTALSLEFKLQDRLHDFVNKLKTKLEEQGNRAQSAVSNIAAAHSTSTEAGKAADKTHHATGDVSQILTCHYCQRPGHTANRCYAKSRDRRREKKQTAASASPAGARASATGAIPKTPQTSASRTLAASASNTPKTPKYCHLHDSRSHSRDECAKVIQLRQEMIAARASNTAPSGEAARTAKNTPG